MKVETKLGRVGLRAPVGLIMHLNGESGIRFKEFPCIGREGFRLDPRNVTCEVAIQPSTLNEGLKGGSDEGKAVVNDLGVARFNNGSPEVGVGRNIRVQFDVTIINLAIGRDVLRGDGENLSLISI